MRKVTWPSREEWAYRRQHPYWDSETGCPFSDKFKHQLSDYANPEEIAALIAALKNLYREKGREQRAAKQRATECGLSDLNWKDGSWFDLPEEQQNIAARPRDLKIERRSINKMLTSISKDHIPWYAWEVEEAQQLLQPILSAYKAAEKAAEAEWERECLQIPVDDAEWEKHLQWRRELEEGHPNWFPDAALTG